MRRFFFPRPRIAFGLGFLIWAFALYFSLRFGAVDDLSWQSVWQLRVPRVILASAVGAALALAGASLQALFTNPLCEPYTLGIASGSALGAVVGASFGLDVLNVYGVAGSAFVGALGFTALLYAVGFRRSNGNLMILLTGVMLGFMGSSLVALWMALSDPSGIQGALFWLLGDLSRAQSSSALVIFAVIAVLGAWIWMQWRDLDGLLLGEEDARALGVDVHRVRRRLIFATSLLVGAAVSSAGMIGFVGLIVPHLARRWVGALHFRLLPFCALMGASALVIADLLARTVARPHELPVGVVTALVGAPLFVVLLVKGGGRVQ